LIYSVYSLNPKGQASRSESPIQAFPMQENDPITLGETPVDLYLVTADGHVILQVNDIYVVQARDLYG